MFPGLLLCRLRRRWWRLQISRCWRLILSGICIRSVASDNCGRSGRVDAFRCHGSSVLHIGSRNGRHFIRYSWCWRCRGFLGTIRIRGSVGISPHAKRVFDNCGGNRGTGLDGDLSLTSEKLDVWLIERAKCAYRVIRHELICHGVEERTSTHDQNPDPWSYYTIATRF